MHTIHALFEEQVITRPDSIAVLNNDTAVSYHELNSKANQLAHYLREKEIKPDTPIAVCLERSVEFLVSILAILKAGGAYVPMDMSHPEHRLSYILDDSNAPIIITLSHLKDKFSSFGRTCIFLDDMQHQLGTYPLENPKPAAKEHHLAYIIYTSGSTGAPKGVLIEHRNVINYCQWFTAFCAVRPEQQVDFSANFIFDMAVSTSIVPLMSGLTVVICDDKIKKNVRLYLHYLNQYRINLIKLTPSYLKVLVQEIREDVIDLPYLNAIILGGENLSTVDCAAWLECYPNHLLYNEYGPTETTVGASVLKVDNSLIKSLGPNVPIGVPGDNMIFRLLDEQGKPVALGEIGELYIGGRCLARGYLNQVELTGEKFIKDDFGTKKSDRLYRTGDLCRQLADNTFEFLERVDQQVKINGFRIEPKEIEESLVLHPAIKEVVVLAQDNTSGEKQLIAYYIPKSVATSPGAKELRKYLQAFLPEYMIPTAFVWVDNFPRTANEKLDRAALPVPQFSSCQHYVPPSTDMERTLASIWSDVLSVKTVGILDDFFELGGYSLLAVRVVAKIENALGKEIALEDFYAAATIANLVQVIKEAKTIDTDRTEMSPSDKAVLPLSDFQLLFWIAHIYEPKLKNLNLVSRRRLVGKLDKASLAVAFDKLVNKHDVLRYQFCKLYPGQYVQKKWKFELIEENLTTFSRDVCESKLLNSINELYDFSNWGKRSLQVIAKLFYLPHDGVELQVCLPHIIADHLSLDILFTDLSTFYLQHQQHHPMDEVIHPKQFKDFLLYELNYNQSYFDRDIRFWKGYLHEVSLFPFSLEQGAFKRLAKETSFSSYQEIPEEALINLQQFCAEKRVSLTSGLTAALGVALVNSTKSAIKITKNIMINIVKSTRENPIYDDKIGCFLRVDTIKMDLSRKPNLASLSAQVHKTVIETMPYQRFPSMAKLTCSNLTNWKRNPIVNYLLNSCIYVYTKLIPNLTLNYKIFSLYGRLSSYKRDNGYVVNINMLDNFLLADKNKKKNHLFGLKLKKTKMTKHDLFYLHKINVLEVCFMRDEDENKPYVVISGKLPVELRNAIAKEIAQVISNETADAGALA